MEDAGLCDRDVTKTILLCVGSACGFDSDSVCVFALPLMCLRGCVFERVLQTLIIDYKRT